MVLKAALHRCKADAVYGLFPVRISKTEAVVNRYGVGGRIDGDFPVRVVLPVMGKGIIEKFCGNALSVMFVSYK